jgi:hypothetical protein
MVYRLLRALPGVHDLVSHRRAQIIIHALNTSPGVPGPHGFAIRIGTARLTIQPRPSHPVSRLVTIGRTPLFIEAGYAYDNHYFLKIERKKSSGRQKFSLTRQANQCREGMGKGVYS